MKAKRFTRSKYQRFATSNVFFWGGGTRYGIGPKYRPPTPPPGDVGLLGRELNSAPYNLPPPPPQPRLTPPQPRRTLNPKLHQLVTSKNIKPAL